MIKEIAKGLAFTLKKMGTHPITVQYPEEQKPVSPRHRGRHILHRYDNGLERCIGCELLRRRMSSRLHLRARRRERSQGADLSR